MKERKKFVFCRVISGREEIRKQFEEERAALDFWMEEKKVVQCRVYFQEVEEQLCLFYFFEAENEISVPGCQARCVYEFRWDGPVQKSGLSPKGMIIGVEDGMLGEYIRLHDEQPQIIRDLCYQNGLRRSSIFVIRAGGGRDYLLQFAEFDGKENQKLYENETYQDWLGVTGACQRPLPGERFWKDMECVYQYNLPGETDGSRGSVCR